MIGLNKVQLIGNVGMKPEVKYSSAGTAIVNLSVATTETWVDKNTGEKQQATEWSKVVAYGKIAEIIGQYCDKGSKVYIEGKLKTRSYEDKEGIKRYVTEIIISGFQGGFQLLDKKDDSHVVVSPVRATEDQQQDANKNPDDIPF